MTTGGGFYRNRAWTSITIATNTRADIQIVAIITAIKTTKRGTMKDRVEIVFIS